MPLWCQRITGRSPLAHKLLALLPSFDQWSSGYRRASMFERGHLALVVVGGHQELICSWFTLWRDGGGELSGSHDEI